MSLKRDLYHSETLIPVLSEDPDSRVVEHIHGVALKRVPQKRRKRVSQKRRKRVSQKRPILLKDADCCVVTRC